jgi:flagellar motor switch protein FliM
MLKRLLRMTQKQAATLSKKIESASIDISIFPRLEELASVLVEACVAAVSGATKKPVQLEKMDVCMADGQLALGELQEGAPIYGAVVADTDQVIFVALAAGFTASLSESLLGGDFTPPEDGACPTDLDIALAKPTIDSFLAPLCAIPPEDAGFRREGVLHPVEVTDKEADMVSSQHDAAFINLSFDLKIEETSAPGVATVHLPTEFLDFRGLLTTVRKRMAIDIDNSRWRKEMEANINQSGIELDIVLDRYKASLTELSKLEVDQIIPITDKAEHSLDITMATSAGRCSIGTGRLGAFEKSKAVKISSLRDPVLL